MYLKMTPTPGGNVI